MQSTQTVTRRYSIKRILDDMPEWLAVKTLAELKTAWNTEETDYANRLINCIQGKGPKLGEERLLQAIKILDATAEQICTPFKEETTRRVKA